MLVGVAQAWRLSILAKVRQHERDEFRHVGGYYRRRTLDRRDRRRQGGAAASELEHPLGSHKALEVARIQKGLRERSA